MQILRFSIYNPRQKKIFCIKHHVIVSEIHLMYVSISKTNLNSYTHSSFTFSPKRFRNSPANKEKEFDLILNDIGTYVI